MSRHKLKRSALKRKEDCHDTVSNHGEFKLKSELQIKIWKKRSSVEEEATLEISQGLQNFTGLRMRIFASEFSEPLQNLATLVDFSLYSFLSFKICPYVIVIIF